MTATMTTTVITTMTMITSMILGINRDFARIIFLSQQSSLICTDSWCKKLAATQGHARALPAAFPLLLAAPVSPVLTAFKYGVQARSLIREGDIEQLLLADELTIMLRDKRAFSGWAEGHITFPPTFKYVPRDGHLAVSTLHCSQHKLYCTSTVSHAACCCNLDDQHCRLKAHLSSNASILLSCYLPSLHRLLLCFMIACWMPLELRALTALTEVCP